MTENLVKGMYMQRNMKNVARKLQAVACMMSKEDTDLEDINVLLIEDDGIDIQMVKFMLSKASSHFHVMVIDNGVSAEKFLTMKEIPHPNFIPDLIILDLHLPGINGVQLLNLILKEQYLQWLPVIVTTTSMDSIPDRKGYENKGLIFLEKPFKKEDLITAMAKKLCLTSLK